MDCRFDSQLAMDTSNKIVPFIWDEHKNIKCSLYRLLKCARNDDRVDRNIDCGFTMMTPSERKYRVKYLWSRARTIYNMIRFIIILRQNLASGEE